MRIALDFDGVIGNIGKLKSEALKILFSISVPSVKTRRKFLVKTGILSEEQYRALQIAINTEERFANMLEPVRAVKMHLKRLIRDGHDITIVSTRTDRSMELAKAWMESGNYPPLPFVGVGWRNDKTPHLEGFDVFVDDDLDKLVPARGVVPHLFLFSWGYNCTDDESGVALRVKSWKELYQRIGNLS